MSTCSHFRNIMVLGGSYGGVRAAQVLAKDLPNNYRIILVDRNSHINHLYVIPRLGVVRGHEHKAFVPYTNVFFPDRPAKTEPIPPSSSVSSSVPSCSASTTVSHSPSHPHIFLHSRVINITPSNVTLDRAFPEYGLHSPVIDYDYLVYALGSHLPAPIDLWGPSLAGPDVAPQTQPGSDSKSGISIPNPRPEKGKGKSGPDPQAIASEYGGSKAEGIRWLRDCQARIEQADSVLVVGGGALGIQFATDIADRHRGKKVTLLHSRKQLLPRFDLTMHAEILKALEDLNVETILGDRLDLSSTQGGAGKFNEQGQRVVRTESGREVAADLLLLCTGQIPNTAFLREMSPLSVNPGTGMAHVLRTMQLGVLPDPNAPLEPRSIPLPPSPPLSPSLDEDHLSSAALSETSPALSPALSSTDSTDDADSDKFSLYSGDSQTGSDTSADLSADEDSTAGVAEVTPFPHIFVIGDAADAFGAINAGHNAYYQGEVAARNILRLARRDSGGPEERLERYKPCPPGIKVSIGLRKSVCEVNGNVLTRDNESEDLDAGLIWKFSGLGDLASEDMFI